MKKVYRKVKQFFKILGPGIITGAADDDPSGIATFSQAGAQFGTKLLWLNLLTVPLMTAIQDACARIGAVTGKGLAAVVKKNYSAKTLVLVVFLITLANTINIAADFGAMAAAVQLLIPIPFYWLIAIFAFLILALEIFLSYRQYAKILKWLCLFLLAYVFALVLSRASLIELIKATVFPKIELRFEYFFLLTGVLGTSISPYMFFWEASEEVEEEKIHHLRKIAGKPQISPQYLKEIGWDNFFGMAASQFTAFCIMAVCAVVLFKNNVTDIKTAADAAEALEPLVAHFPNAGYLAKLIFALGIIGLGFLAIPVLAGSAAYAVAEAFSWNEGLSRKLNRAKGFYGVIIISTLLGAFLNLLGLDPIKLLIITAVINGLVAIPLIYVIIKITNNQKIMGNYVNGKAINFFLYLTLAIMSLSAVIMFLTFK